MNPTGITAKKIGVGACLWDGALVLAAYLLTLPRHRFHGARCVELGAGVGTAGLVAALLGAQAIITDIPKVLPLLLDNLAANGFDPAKNGCGSEGQAWAWGQVIQWGADGWMQGVRSVAARGIDLVLAADCCYIDQDGESPSTPAFVETCAGLCGPDTVVLVSFERRSPQVRQCFLDESRRRFSRVEKLSLVGLPAALRLEYVDLWQLRL
ncbi:hypothetical protein QBZ16_003758 [Prototheca wickerhamii]|uniref:Uncharacterized protein n=1 Tax=Prototheca wickerhamii TaxID=3111 RepID=A0AAD9IIP5_PROWI|nr:hypothetical protein QBZ16_003758 [Prototheca wickerhamii]